jgi:hypothetical protein
MVRAVLVMFLSASVAFVASRGCSTAVKANYDTPAMSDVDGGVCKLGTTC